MLNSKLDILSGRINKNKNDIHHHNNKLDSLVSRRTNDFSKFTKGISENFDVNILESFLGKLKEDNKVGSEEISNIFMELLIDGKISSEKYKELKKKFSF